MREYGNRGAAGRGFSLIELMFVVAIVGIISMVAIPAYTKQLQKNQRAVAKARIVQAAQLLERFYSDNNSYFVAAPSGVLVVGTASTAAGFALLMNVSGTVVYSGSNNETTSSYVVTLATATANSFTLTATPQAGNAQAGDTACAALTLTNAGVKGITGTGQVSDCW